MNHEALLKSSFSAELKRQLPYFLTLQFSTAGAPDRGLIGNSMTSYWEFKHATPDFDSPGNQELLCARIAVETFCRYVIWYEKDQTQETRIVHPLAVLQRRVHGLTSEAYCHGFDHEWLVGFIKGVHGVS